MPDTQHANDISALVTEIKRIEYISQKTYSTEEEKTIVRGFELGLDEKKDRLVDLLQQAYGQSTAVYQYNTYELSELNFDTTVKMLQKKMYDNIYTKRLSARLLESVAPKVLTEQKGRLHSLFGAADDFKFFDTTGNFIGNTLAVTTEILAKATSFISGAELEKQLSAPPTGYSLGTIMTSVAALFRGNKIIVKYGGNDFNSPLASGAKDIFANARNFTRASFKAVSQSLSYKERTKIIDILKEDCEYKKWTGENLSYQMNDFDVVDAIRLLSKEILSQVNREIALNERLSQLFSGSLQTKAVFLPFTPSVTEANCFSQARAFLNQKDEYIKAVERVEKDFDFIKNNFRRIERIKDYIEDVKKELESANCDMQLINPIAEEFQQCYETDVVSNYQTILNLEQQARDMYYKLFQGITERVNVLYTGLREKADAVRQQLDAYPREWNARLYRSIDQFDSQCRRYQVNRIDIPQYEIRCRVCGLQLRDLVYAENMAPQREQEILLWQSEIVKTAPKPIPQPPSTPSNPTPKPEPKPQPKTRSMKSYLPQGKQSVAQYRQWLTSQLSLLQSFDATDELDFNN